MKEVVLISGGTGFVGKNLANLLQDKYSLRFLTRGKSNGDYYHWNIDNHYIDPEALLDIDYVIHLAGTSVTEKRWTERRKAEILNSRIQSAELILKSLKHNQQKIRGFISASGSGYYGTVPPEKTLVETDENGNDFLSQVCHEWESIATAFQKEGVADRSVSVRIGVVFGKNGGALQKMAGLIKNNIGSALGDGRQFMPWIHLDDLSRIFLFSLSNPLEGAYNAVAPEHITNSQLTRAIANTLGKSIILPKVPAFVLKLILGEMSTILLNGNMISSQKINDAGFSFQFDTLQAALADSLYHN